MFGVFRLKNHDFTPKNLIFSNFRGARAECPPHLDPPLVDISCSAHDAFLERSLI